MDYCLAFGAVILGHAHPRVRRAVEEQLGRGWIYALLTEQEVEFAERIKRHMPSVEKMRIVNSGTEATMNAIRLARGFTKRDVVIKFDGNFHGLPRLCPCRSWVGRRHLGRPHQRRRAARRHQAHRCGAV